MDRTRQELIQAIEDTFGNLIGELSRFDDDTFNQVPVEGSWTAGQATEHIIICGSGIPDSQTSQANRPYDEKVEAVKELFLNFEIKFKTDPSIAPGPAPHDKDELLGKINKIMEHLRNTAKTTDLEALCGDMELPTFGLLTRYEWLRFILFHTQRHTHQISTIGKHLTRKRAI